MTRLVVAVLLALSSSVVLADEPPPILQQAVASAQSIGNADERAKKLVAIAELQSAAGEHPAAVATLKEALNAAGLIEEADRRADRLQAVVEAQVRVGDIPGAAAAAAAIEDRKRLVDPLIIVGIAYAEAGDRSAAAATLQQAREVAESLRFAPVAEILAKVAMAQAAASDRPAAVATLERAVAVMAERASDPARSSSALAAIAEAQAALDEGSAAESSLRQAQAMAASIESPISRRSALHTVAMVQIRIGDRSAARETLQQAAAAARLELPPMNSMALMEIGEAQIDADDSAAAALSLREARDLAAGRDISLGRIAAIQAGVGQEAIPDAFREALAAALKSVGDGDRGPAAGPPTRGDMEAALATAALIQDPWPRFHALMTISAPWLAAGDHVALQPLMREAAAVADELENSGTKFAALEDLALVAVAGGNVDPPLDWAKRMAANGAPAHLTASIAWVQAEMGDSVAARSTLDTVLTGSASFPSDDLLLHLIALAQANAGDLTAALATLDRVADPWLKTDALIAIAADDPPPEPISFRIGRYLR